MLLTCPDCRSGLEVPDGTTALVRCPACQKVFNPSDVTRRRRKTRKTRTEAGAAAAR
jgi:LSD1 subclass zinc finger protein